MKTIQSVELRKNMSDYLKRVSNGEKFRVSYRGKALAVLAADDHLEETSNVAAVFAAAEKFRQSLSPDARLRLSKMTDDDVKRIRDEHMKEKYGI